MKKIWKSRTAYFLSGMVLSLLSIYLGINWMDIVPYSSYDQQPAWLRFVDDYIVGALPWYLFAFLIIYRIIKGKQVKIGAYFLGAALPTVLLVGYMMFYPAVENYQHQQKFDAKLWQTQKENMVVDDLFPPRLCMVDDLIASKTLTGLSKEEVITLLGEPEPKGFPWGEKGNYIFYYLGPERGFIRIDSEWLMITFDKSNKVKRYWIATD